MDNRLLTLKINKIQAFTLAEVLITLGIIGVVAAMTIPVLLQNAQDREFKSAWKKEYAVLNQAIQQIYAEEGDTYSSSRYPDHNYMQRYFCKVQNKLKVADSAMNCQNYKGIEDTIPADSTGISAPYANGKFYWHANGAWTSKNGLSATSNGGYSKFSMLLNDGALVFFNCSTEFLVDVNGYKKPNIIGKDIFGVNISQTKPYPKLYFFSNSPDGAHYDSCAASPALYNNLQAQDADADCESGTGWGCSAKYILNND